MAKKFEFDKKCNTGKLKQELKDALFDVDSVSNCQNRTMIILSDTETKDPTSIVSAHVYTPHETPEEYIIRIKQEFIDAPSPDGKINVIAKYLGIA